MLRSKPNEPDSLAALLGGRRAGVDASAPTVGFVLGWLLGGHSIWWGAGTALVIAACFAAWRIRRGDPLRAVLLGLLFVAVAALVALYTGEARDFFLVQLLTNVASALAWTVSIAVRWPFLGLVVGTLLGQRTAWRRDPALLRAYSIASWVWVAQYAVRVVVFSVLYLADAVVALGVARVALTWPLVALCIAVSAWVLRWSLPAGHPGIRRPQRPSATAAETETDSV